MLAPQRGLFATVESKGNRNSKSHVIQMARAMLTVMRKGILPELSNFYCHPGKAGGSPFCNRKHASTREGDSRTCGCCTDVHG